MAFDFLGNPTPDQLAEFESFFEEEFQTFDQRISHIKGNLVRLKRHRANLLSESAARGITPPVDFDGEAGPVITRTDDSEMTFFDAPAANKMLDFKTPFIETIKSKRERLESAIRRVYFAITKENERLVILQTDQAELLETFTAAKTIITESNLFKKDNKNEA